MKKDHQVIASWVKPNSRVLDLGCGDGSLLDYLGKEKQVSGYGLEIAPKRIAECVGRGVSVLEQNFDEGLSNFPDDSFDLVILAYTLQATKRPDVLVKEMLRVGKQAVVTFPNFSYWPHRMHLLWRGKMPVSKHLPYTWYDTPNIHHCTIKDFNQLCRDESIKILQQNFVGLPGLTQVNPNLFSRQAMYLICK